MLGKSITRMAACALAATVWGNNVHAGVAANARQQGQPADLAIALDVSGSMGGLIDSAKQHLWDIVNTIAQAQPEPDLRLAILTYGNPGYGKQNGYNRIDRPFTRDLDAVMETLFSFETNGGDEYVAGVVHTATHELDWSTRPHALRILFVAGNEGADQDPQTSIRLATSVAAAYRNDYWDMVDALGAGVSIENMDVDDLPTEMKALAADEREPYVQASSRCQDDGGRAH